MVGDRMRAKTPNGTLKEPKGVAQCTDAVRNWISAGTCASDWHFLTLSFHSNDSMIAHDTGHQSHISHIRLSEIANRSATS